MAVGSNDEPEDDDRADPAPEGIDVPRTFLRHCVLLLLSEEQAHGYSLLTQLEALGIGRSGCASVYHLLRKLEKGGLVESVWDLPEGPGPARKIYQLTPTGRESLAASAGDVQACNRLFETMVERYAGGSMEEQP